MYIGTIRLAYYSCWLLSYMYIECCIQLIMYCMIERWERLWYYTVWWCPVGTVAMISSFRSKYCTLGGIPSSKNNDYTIIHSSSSCISSSVDCWVLYVSIYIDIYRYIYIDTIRWYYTCCLFNMFIAYSMVYSLYA